MRTLVIAAVLATATSAAAKPRHRVEVRLDPPVAEAGALVEVYVLDAGTTAWTHHSPGGSDGCARPLRATIVARHRRAEACTEALVGPRDTTLAPGQSIWVDTLHTDGLAPGTSAVAVEGVPTPARLRIVRAKAP